MVSETQTVLVVQTNVKKSNTTLVVGVQVGVIFQHKLFRKIVLEVALSRTLSPALFFAQSGGSSVGGRRGARGAGAGGGLACTKNDPRRHLVAARDVNNSGCWCASRSDIPTQTVSKNCFKGGSEQNTKPRTLFFLRKVVARQSEEEEELEELELEEAWHA